LALLRRILRISGGLGYTPAAPWWLYRKSHVINPASGAGTDYQIRITAHYGAGVDSGEHVYLNGKCRADFGDIRFTGSDGEIPLFYWMEEKVDGDYAVFWVRVEEDLSTNPVTIYIYYGNPDATTISNGEATFDFFDDFESGTLNKWTVLDPTVDISTATVKQGSYSARTTDYTANAVARTNTLPPSNCASESWIYAGADNAYVGLRFTDKNNQYTFGIRTPHSLLRIEKKVGGSWSVVAEGTYSVPAGWYRIIAKVYGSSLKLEVYREDGSLVGTLSATDTSLTSGYGVIGVYKGTAYHDVYRIRKYVDPEPSHGAWGPEETAPF